MQIGWPSRNISPLQHPLLPHIYPAVCDKPVWNAAATHTVLLCWGTSSDLFHQCLTIITTFAESYVTSTEKNEICTIQPRALTMRYWSYKFLSVKIYETTDYYQRLCWKCPIYQLPWHSASKCNTIKGTLLGIKFCDYIIAAKWKACSKHPLWTINVQR